MNDTVIKDITINAPIQVVWSIVTKLDKWFAETANFELQPGRKGTIGWKEMGEAPIEVVTVDQPNTFAFLWVAPDEETKKVNGQTLVTLHLSEVNDGTKVSVEESGFSKLALTDDEKTELIGKHTEGWTYFVSQIQVAVKSVLND